MPKFERLTNWKQLIESEMADYGESFADIEAITLTEEELNRPFDAGVEGDAGQAFTAWTAQRVYFPASLNGADWCMSVPRHPCDEFTFGYG